MIPAGYVVARAHAHGHMVRLLESGYRVWFAERGDGVQILARPLRLGINLSTGTVLDFPAVERVLLP